VYGIVDGAEQAARLADQVRSLLSTSSIGGDVYEGPFRADGARVWHEPHEPAAAV
jgi:hypothetical protein